MKNNNDLFLLNNRSYYIYNNSKDIEFLGSKSFYTNAFKKFDVFRNNYESSSELTFEEAEETRENLIQIQSTLFSIINCKSVLSSSVSLMNDIYESKEINIRQEINSIIKNRFDSEENILRPEVLMDKSESESEVNTLLELLLEFRNYIDNLDFNYNSFREVFISVYDNLNFLNEIIVEYNNIVQFSNLTIDEKLFLHV